MPRSFLLFSCCLSGNERVMSSGKGEKRRGSLYHCQSDQGRRDPLQGQNKVNAAGVNGGTWHSERVGSRFVLGDSRSPALPDGAYAVRPVPVGPSQHDADGTLLVDRRNGLEQRIERRTGMMDFRSVHQGQSMLRRNEEVTAWGSGVNGPGVKRLAFLCLPNGKPAAVAEYFMQVTWELRRDMLHDHDGQGEILRQDRQQKAQGFHPADRSPDSHHVESRAGKFRYRRCIHWCLRSPLRKRSLV